MINAIGIYIGNSQRGRGSATAPSPLIANSLATTTSNLMWDDTGADNYILQRATDSGYSDAAQVYSGALLEFDDSGLTADTTYYYRVKAQVTGSSDSEWATASIKTLAAVPVGEYSVEGVNNQASNDYADITSLRITTWKNISSGAGPDFALSSGSGLSGVPSNSKRFGVSGIPSSGIYTSATDLTLTGDFCIGVYAEPPSGAFLCAIAGHTDDNVHMWISSGKTALQVRINSTNYTLNFPSAIPANTPAEVLWKRVGNKSSASNDGGYTYGAEVTVSTADLRFNRILGSEASRVTNAVLWETLVFFDQVLTGDQLSRYFEPLKSAAYTPAEEITPSPVFTGVWRDLVDGRTDDTVSIFDNGSNHWRNVWSKGNYGFFKPVKESDPDDSEQLLMVLDYTTGKMSTGKLLATYPESITAPESHNQSSILIFDNTVWQIGHNTHYGLHPGVAYNSFKVRKFRKNYDLRNYTQMPVLADVPTYIFAEKGYTQGGVVNGRMILLNQIWSSWGDGLQISYSDDRLNYFTTTRVFTTTAPTWAYPYLLCNGTLNEAFFVIHELENGASRYRSLSLLRTTDFLTFYNYDQSYSFTINPNTPINLTTIVANCAMRETSADTVKDLHPGNTYIDENEFVYGIHGNGEDTGWEVTYSNAGWQHIAVQFPAAQNIVLPPGGAGTNYNRVSPVVYKDDADLTNNTFSVLALCDPNSDGLYRVGKFTTTDRFATEMTFDGYVSTDHTKKHWHLQPDFNYHFNDHAGVMGTVVDGTLAYPWFYQMK